jgi:hypothetical protein
MISPRLIRFAIWALLGAAVTYLTVGLLDLFGLLLIISLVIVGLAAFTIRRYEPVDLLGLAFGPAILFGIFGELDDAPGLVLIGLLLIVGALTVGVRRVLSSR